MVSTSLQTFRRKMMNPVHWRKANSILSKYTKPALASQSGAEKLIAELSEAFNVAMTQQERVQAAKWIVQQGIDPQSRRERMMLWKKAKS